MSDHDPALIEAAARAIAPSHALRYDTVNQGLRDWLEGIAAGVLDAVVPRIQGNGDDSDVEAGRCCPYCRNYLTDHNRAVWNAGYSVATRHARGG